MPQRASFYDAGGPKICLNVRFMTPEDLSTCLNVRRFMTPEDLRYANKYFVTTCSVSVRASAAGLDHEDRVPTGVDTCGLCKLAHGRRPWAGGRLQHCLYVRRLPTAEDFKHVPQRVSFYDTGGLKHGLDVRRLMTTEDLNMNTGGHMTTCGIFSRTSAGGPDHGGQNTDRRQRLSPQHVRPI
ncbi:hypothetical protein Taro_032149 [Colocasia esculenta]|uniref:Uncharacterized protein n=1 Tax=Colocasia esculenta TaxID=4460 RepID=A0A843VYH3_COLES|nr:hypothetical protein [Colocasia esculenta]